MDDVMSLVVQSTPNECEEEAKIHLQRDVSLESTRRSDFPDEAPRSSVYSTIGKRIRSWIRFPLPPGSVQGGEPPKGFYASKASAPPRIVTIETPAISLGESNKLSSDFGQNLIAGEGDVQGDAPVGTYASYASGPSETISFEDLAISLDEVNKLTGSFHQMSLVGQGWYGQVFRATLSTGEAIAVKKLYPDSLGGSDYDFAARLADISKLKHEYLSGLLGYCLDLNQRILIYPFATMASLHDILHGRKGVQGSKPGPVLTWNQRVKIAFCAARGLEFLHDERIVHGDIKSNNILVFDDYVSKIADIYLGNKSPYKDILPWHAARVGNSSYPYFPPFPPEYSMTKLLTRKGDIYRFGVVLLELLTGRKVVDYTMPGGQQSLVTWAIPRLGKDRVHECIDPKLNTDYPPKAVAKMAAIAALCVQYKAEFRPDMETVVKCMQPLLKVGGADDYIPPPPPSFT